MSRVGLPFLADTAGIIHIPWLAAGGIPPRDAAHTTSPAALPPGQAINLPQNSAKLNLDQ